MIYAESYKPVSIDDVVPSYCTNVLEMNMFVMEHAEEEWNKMFMEFGIDELKVYRETGEIVVYEKGNFKNTVNNITAQIKKWITDLFEGIKGIFNKLLDKMEEVRKNLVNKGVGKVKADDIKKIPDGKFPKNLKCYEIFDGSDYAKKVESNTSSLISSYKSVFSKAVTSNDPGYINDLKDDYSGSTLLYKLTGISGCSDISKAQTALKNKMITAVSADKNWVVNNWSKIIEVCLNGKIKRDINKILDSQNKLKKSALDFVSGYDKDKEANVIKFASTGIKSIIQASTSILTSISNNSTMLFKSCSRLSLRVALATLMYKNAKDKEDKKDDEKATNESTEIDTDPSSTASYIGGLFNF